MRTLTAAQGRALVVIVDAIDRDGAPPTLREIAVALGFRSTNAATSVVRALARKGYVQERERKSRARLPTAKAYLDLQRVATGPRMRQGVVFAAEQVIEALDI